jgi:hypothetical protein
MIVPVVYQAAGGSGHKGSHSLWTTGKGPWQQADEFGARERPLLKR